MKKILLIAIILFVCRPLPVFAKSCPMVERHMFLPAPEDRGAYKSLRTLKLEKELMFTGVVKSSLGDWAIIRTRSERTDETSTAFRKEGDEINGMVIREIGNNFLIMTSDGKAVRLNLYHEGKSRPETPADTVAESANADKGRTIGVDGASARSETFESIRQDRKDSKQTTRFPVKGAERQVNTRKDAPTPFSRPTPATPFSEKKLTKEMPPNPFMQNKEMPPNPFEDMMEDE